MGEITVILGSFGVVGGVLGVVGIITVGGDVGVGAGGGGAGGKTVVGVGVLAFITGVGVVTAGAGLGVVAGGGEAGSSWLNCTAITIATIQTTTTPAMINNLRMRIPLEDRINETWGSCQLWEYVRRGGTEVFMGVLPIDNLGSSV